MYMILSGLTLSVIRCVSEKTNGDLPPQVTNSNHLLVTWLTMNENEWSDKLPIAFHTDLLTQTVPAQGARDHKVGKVFIGKRKMLVRSMYGYGKGPRSLFKSGVPKWGQNAIRQIRIRSSPPRVFASIYKKRPVQGNTVVSEWHDSGRRTLKTVQDVDNVDMLFIG